MGGVCRTTRCIRNIQLCSGTVPHRLRSKLRSALRVSLCCSFARILLRLQPLPALLLGRLLSLPTGTAFTRLLVGLAISGPTRRPRKVRSSSDEFH